MTRQVGGMTSWRFGHIPADARHASGALDPMDRIGEILFGLIMVLTITGALSIAEAGRPQIRAMLFGALGCNLAWGLIDAVMYLMGCLAERARDLRTILAVRSAPTPGDARAAIAEALPQVVASALHDTDYDKIRHAVAGMSLPAERARLTAQDWAGALGVFLLVSVSILPVLVPFLVVQDPGVALRLSNAVALAMLFGTGYRFGQLAGYAPAAVGCGTAAIGILLVSLTIALGG
jgi:hypothetical protein